MCLISFFLKSATYRIKVRNEYFDYKQNIIDFWTVGVTNKFTPRCHIGFKETEGHFGLVSDILQMINQENNSKPSNIVT